MNEKKKFLIFLLILISFMSISGISASAMDNTTSIDEGISLDGAVAIDNSFNNQLSQDLNNSNDYLIVPENTVSKNLSSENIKCGYAK